MKNAESTQIAVFQVFELLAKNDGLEVAITKKQNDFTLLLCGQYTFRNRENRCDAASGFYQKIFLFIRTEVVVQVVPEKKEFLLY